jgi:addiction module HigA family antidote
MTNPLTKGLRPIHPGEMLREDILPAVGRPKTEISRLLGISRQTLYDILNEKQPVTPTMALRLAKMFGGSAESWTNMQRNYDLKIAEIELGDALDKIPFLEAA